MEKTLFVLTALCTMTANVNVNPCEGEENGWFADNPETCQDYFICYNGNSHPFKCPKGFSFDVARQMCWYWDEVECGDLLDPCYGKPHFSFVERPSGTCVSYYRCEYNVGVPLDCPEGFYFDVANQMCNFPDQVDCEDYPEKPFPPTPSSTEGTVPISPNQAASITKKSGVIDISMCFLVLWLPNIFVKT